MAVLYIILIIIGLTAQNVAKKAFNVKFADKAADTECTANARGGGSGSVFTFGLISVLCTLLFFVFSSGFKLDFRLEVLPYSVGFALSYCTALIFSFYAIKYGSLSLSSLIGNYSLIIPTFFGILFLDEETSLFFFLGIAALMISLFLVNYKRTEKAEKTVDKGSKGNRTDPRWFLFIALSFLGNGICSTVQTVQQKSFEGQYKSEMMIMALAIVAVILLTITLITERRNMIPVVKKGGIYMLLNGGFNGMVNLFVMLCAVIMNASVMFPIISAGGIIGTALISVLLYNEKLSKMQYVGFVLGIAAIVMLNL